MHHEKLILLDFDGVIVNGIDEYWYSSKLACEKYLLASSKNLNLNYDIEVPKLFAEIRPWVKYGWEMVLLTHEIIKEEEPLNDSSKNKFLQNYQQNCHDLLEEKSWESQTLQISLDKARQSQIRSDLDKWINLHNPFNEVISFIKTAHLDGFRVGIISTKGRIFTSKIINQFKIYPELIFGYESGSKVDIISSLTENYEIIGFIEDRRKTLVKILENKTTKDIPCFLANWGYLKKSDRHNLHPQITLLNLNDLKNLLANLN